MDVFCWNKTWLIDWWSTQLRWCLLEGRRTNKSDVVTLFQHTATNIENVAMEVLSYKLTNCIQIQSSNIGQTRKKNIPISFSSDNKIFHQATAVGIRNHRFESRKCKISMSTKYNASWVWWHISLTLDNRQLHTITNQSPNNCYEWHRNNTRSLGSYCLKYSCFNAFTKPVILLDWSTRLAFLTSVQLKTQQLTRSHCSNSA